MENQGGLSLKYGIYEGTLDSAFGSVSRNIADYFRSSLNISYGDFYDITAEENENFDVESIFKNNLDIAFMPFSMNGGWYYVHYSYTTSLMYSDMVIMSGSPREIIETSFSGYYIFQNEVLICICLSWISTSVINTLCDVLLRNQRIKFSTKRFFSKLWSHSWNYFWTFLRLPIPRMNSLRHISYRLLTGAWLLLVLIIVSQLSGSFTARMSSVSYTTIDSFHQLTMYKNMELLVYNQSFEHKTMRLKAEEDETIRNILMELELNERFYFYGALLFNETFLRQINETKISVITNTFFFRAFADYNQDDEGYQFYLSRSQAPVIQGLLVSNNVSRTLRKSINVRLAWIFERQTFGKIFMECDRYGSKHKWKPPASNNIVYPLSMKDMSVGMALLVISLTIAICVFAIENTTRLMTKLFKLQNFVIREDVTTVGGTTIFVRPAAKGRAKKICIEFEVDE